MKTKEKKGQNSSSFEWKWQNLCFSLCLLLGAITSCETEEFLYQSRFPANNLPSTRQTFFEPKEFFAYTDSTLKTVVSALSRVDKEKHFTASFLLKYGIPLWNFTYKSVEEEETCLFVPLYRLDKPRSIDALWLLRIKDGQLTYFPLKRDDELMEGNDQSFVFDLLSYMVFGEENAQGLVFKPHAETRGTITVTQCWDVYTGPEGHLEYSYTNCISHTYWVDDAFLTYNWNNNEGGGSGSIELGGGGSSGGSGSSPSTPAGDIFKKEADQDSTLWLITENMIKRIREDCLGESLYDSLKNQVKNNKINLEFDFGKGYSYNFTNRTLHVGLEELESNKLLHEMFHVLQTTQESTSSFQKAMMNREIEAHYAQYLYLQRSTEWTEKKKKEYSNNQRLRATTSLKQYVNQQGNVTVSKPEELDFFELYLSNNVVSAFKKEEGYKDYPFKEYPDISDIFPTIKSVTKNCK